MHKIKKMIDNIKIKIYNNYEMDFKTDSNILIQKNHDSI